MCRLLLRSNMCVFLAECCLIAGTLSSAAPTFAQSCTESKIIDADPAIVEYFGYNTSLSGDTLTGVATARLLMSSFGIEPLSFVNTLTVADEFGIEVKFTARE